MPQHGPLPVKWPWMDFWQGVHVHFIRVMAAEATVSPPIKVERKYIQF
jgi:hypothetical protein